MSEEVHAKYPGGDEEAKQAALPVIAELLDKGTRAYAMEDWEMAVEAFGDMSSVTEKAFGSESLRYADALVMYGRALVQNAISNINMLAESAMEKITSKGKGKETSEDSVKLRHIQFGGEPDFRDLEGHDEDQTPGTSEVLSPSTQRLSDAGVSGEAGPSNRESEGAHEMDKYNDDAGTTSEGDGESDGAGEYGIAEDDLLTALQVLNLARSIQAGVSDEKTQRKLAETSLLLGDVAMELEEFDKAAEEYIQALEVKKQYLGQDDRELAEAYYKVALAHDYGRNSEEAIKYITEVKAVLGRHRQRLTKEQSEAGEEAAKKLKEELDEIDGLLEEVNTKCEEWKIPRESMVATTSVDQNSAIPDGVKEIIHRALSTGQVNDLTSLVRSKNKKVVRESPGESADAPSTSNGNKRKTADEAASDESAKKVRAKAADPQ